MPWPMWFQTLSLTPQEFSTLASAWVGSLVTTISVIIGALLYLSPKLATLKDRIDNLFRLHDANKADITSQQQQITQVALNVPTTVNSNPVTDLRSS